MWLLDAAKPAVQKAFKPVMTFGRTIAQKGNGMQRVIVEGFGGRNLNPATHFKNVSFQNMFNYRPVIKGFNRQLNDYPGMVTKPLTAKPGCGRLKFFPLARNPRISRHVVYDIQPPRIQVKGFCLEPQNTVSIVGKPAAAPVKLPTMRELAANERVVVQGFGGNTSTKPVYKPMNTPNNTQRVVVRGFNSTSG